MHPTTVSSYVQCPSIPRSVFHANYSECLSMCWFVHLVDLYPLIYCTTPRIITDNHIPQAMCTQCLDILPLLAYLLTYSLTHLLTHSLTFLPMLSRRPTPWQIHLGIKHVFESHINQLPIDVYRHGGFGQRIKLIDMWIECSWCFQLRPAFQQPFTTVYSFILRQAHPSSTAHGKLFPQPMVGTSIIIKTCCCWWVKKKNG